MKFPQQFRKRRIMHQCIKSSIVYVLKFIGLSVILRLCMEININLHEFNAQHTSHAQHISYVQRTPIESNAQRTSIESTQHTSHAQHISYAQRTPIESNAQRTPIESNAQRTPIESAQHTSNAPRTSQAYKNNQNTVGIFPPFLFSRFFTTQNNQNHGKLLKKVKKKMNVCLTSHTQRTSHTHGTSIESNAQHTPHPQRTLHAQGASIKSNAQHTSHAQRTPHAQRGMYSSTPQRNCAFAQTNYDYNLNNRNNNTQTLSQT